eukprot:c1125_g1_i1.p1 GENE.c1125_g1_i1~~c1125_g1_i1.p1  ORF type:complete len:221 (+),score=41.10 c1125_g1_i1:37-699(+)
MFCGLARRLLITTPRVVGPLIVRTPRCFAHSYTNSFASQFVFKNNAYHERKVDLEDDEPPQVFAPGEEIEFEVTGEIPLQGLQLKINDDFMGVIYDSELPKSRKLEVGDKGKGYVLRHPDERRKWVVITLSQPGFKPRSTQSMKQVLDALRANSGVIPLGDKSPPEDIQFALGISKSNFKVACGILMKRGKVKVSADEVALLRSAPPKQLRAPKYKPRRK